MSAIQVPVKIIREPDCFSDINSIADSTVSTGASLNSLSVEVTSQKLVVNYVRSGKMLSVDRNVVKSIFIKFL